MSASNISCNRKFWHGEHRDQWTTGSGSSIVTSIFHPAIVISSPFIARNKTWSAPVYFSWSIVVFFRTIAITTDKITIVVSNANMAGVPINRMLLSHAGVRVVASVCSDLLLRCVGKRFQFHCSDASPHLMVESLFIVSNWWYSGSKASLHLCSNGSLTRQLS